jgi:hypothetical protein
MILVIVLVFVCLVLLLLIIEFSLFCLSLSLVSPAQINTTTPTFVPRRYCSMICVDKLIQPSIRRLGYPSDRKGESSPALSTPTSSI